MSRSVLAAAGTAAAAAIALGCADIGAPQRTDIYEWRLVSGTDTLNFHWPQSSLPVKVWAEPIDNLDTDADSSIAAWNGVFLYGEYHAVRVTDSSSADIILVEGQPPAGDDVLLSRVSLESMAPECQAATLPHVDDLHQAHLPMHVYIAARFAVDLPTTQSCFALTVTHELGHTLGIFQHSTHPDDIMYGNPTVTAPSERDRNTAETLYHTPANIVPVRGP